MERDELTGQPDVSRCEWCDIPLTGIRRGSSYCSRAHKNSARRARKRSRERVDSLRGRYPFPDDVSLSELDARRREARASIDPGDELRRYTDFGMIPGDGDEQTTRFHQMIEADAARRVPRQSWFSLKRKYAANPGVEAADITQERVDRHQAQQRAVRARLRSSTMQPQDRHNPVTRDAVATRANVSRRLNKARTTMDPRPPAQRQSYSWDEAEQATWDAYRGGRARGQQSRHASYQWDMTGGWTY